MRSSAWALILYDWSPFAKGDLETGAERRQPCAGRGGGLGSTAPPASWSWASGLQDREGTRFCCLSRAPVWRGKGLCVVIQVTGHLSGPRPTTRALWKQNVFSGWSPRGRALGPGGIWRTVPGSEDGGATRQGVRRPFTSEPVTAGGSRGASCSLQELSPAGGWMSWWAESCPESPALPDTRRPRQPREAPRKSRAEKSQAKPCSDVAPTAP